MSDLKPKNPAHMNHIEVLNHIGQLNKQVDLKNQENAQLKQRIEQLECECNFMRGELVDSYCMNPIWLDEQIEQLRKVSEV